MVTMVVACGPDRISHGDGTGGGDSTTTDGDTGNADTSTGEPPPLTIPGEGPYGAGTRLVPVVERSEDGVTQFLHWYDSELGIDCEFVRDSVGTYRCLPVETFGGTVGFGDEACAVPVVGVASCASVGSHVRGVLAGAAECSEGPRHQAYLRGGPIGAGNVGRFDAYSGSCASFARDYPERYALEPVSDDIFVAGVAVTEVRGTVQVRAIVAEDGAFVRDRLVHPRFGTVCAAWQTGDVGVEGLSCGAPSSGSRGFSDAACTSAVYAVDDDGTCASASSSIIVIEDGWYGIGEAWDGSRYDLDVEGTCAPAEPPTFDPFTYHQLGAPIEPVETPEFAVQVVPEDPGRLRRVGVAGDGETLVLPGVFSSSPHDDTVRWYDSLLDQGCRTADDAEGTLRCFPLPFATPNRVDVWGDPECSSTPLFETAEPPPYPFTRITRVTVDDCGSAEVESLQNVVGPWDGPTYRMTEGGTCEAEEFPEFISVYQLGNYAQLDDAPALELLADG